MKTDRQASYRLFVMTFWLEDEGSLAEPDTWRFRVEEPRNGARWGCVGLMRFVFLLSEKIADKAVLMDRQNHS